MENGKMIFGSANCKLADVPSGIANAAQPHALNFTPSADIYTLAASGHDVAINAQAVLSLLYDSAYTREPEPLPEEALKWDEEEELTVEQQNEENTLKQIGVYPNPFNNNFSINYILEQEATEVRIEVYDLLGRNLFTKATGKTINGNIMINLEECLGVYVLKMFADDKPIHTEKVICIQK